MKIDLAECQNRLIDLYADISPHFNIDVQSLKPY